LNSIARIAVALGMISLLAIGSAQTAQDLDYDVFADGERIGSMSVLTRAGGNDSTAAVETVVRVKLRVKRFFSTVFSLDSEETNLVGAAGLLRHDSRSKIDGIRVAVRGARGDGVFTLRVETNGETQTYLIALNDFDCSSIEGPRLEFAVPGATLHFRVLDLDRLEIIERSFTWVGDETVRVNGRPVACRVVDVSDSFSRSRRWIARDSIETLIKEEGTDEDGPFRIVLTRYLSSARYRSGHSCSKPAGVAHGK